jgi:hypothetical protein
MKIGNFFFTGICAIMLAGVLMPKTSFQPSKRPKSRDGVFMRRSVFDEIHEFDRRYSDLSTRQFRSASLPERPLSSNPSQNVFAPQALDQLRFEAVPDQRENRHSWKTRLISRLGFRNEAPRSRATEQQHLASRENAP